MIEENEILNADIGLMKSAINGVKKDPEDERDFIFKAEEEIVSSLPPSVDLRKFSGEIENQLRTGSCVANATCSALELMSTEKDNKVIDLSRLFVYYFAREPYPELKEKDNGAYLRDGFKVCNKLGVPTEDKWEFIEEKVNERPSEEAIKSAPDNKVIRYERIADGDINGVKAALLKGNPVIFGMYVYYDFFYLSGPLETQNYLGSRSGSSYAGGHAMSIVGYDDNLNGGSFIVENSWSDRWGDKGYWAMSYEVFRNDVMDLWTCTEFKTGLLNPEPKPEPEPEEPDYSFDEDDLDFFLEDLIKLYKKMYNKLLEMLVHTPNLTDIIESLKETLRVLYRRIKNFI